MHKKFSVFFNLFSFFQFVQFFPMKNNILLYLGFFKIAFDILKTISYSPIICGFSIKKTRKSIHVFLKFSAGTSLIN